MAPDPATSPDPFVQAQALRFSTPQALAAALAHAETAVRSGSAAEVDLATLAHSEDAAYRQLVDQPAWLATVLTLLPVGLRPVAQANVMAGEDLRALSHPRDQFPAWRIIAPRPRAELLADYQEAERLTGIPWQYLAAINLVESRMGRVMGLSPAGAGGPMQFIPATWAAYGRGDINNPRDAILAAGRLLAAHGGPADMAGALLAYNPSQHYVRAVSAYAQQLQAEPRALAGYYYWQVYLRTATHGEALLAEGWSP